MNNLVDPNIESASEIIFVDAGIDNYQGLIPSDTPAEIVILDSNRDEIEHITQSLGTIEPSSANLDNYTEFRGAIEIDNSPDISGLETIIDYENFADLDSLVESQRRCSRT